MKKFTVIARCQVCKKEVNRAEHVPENELSGVCMRAPFVAICDVKSHNTYSDCNFGCLLEEIEEPQVAARE